jgi:general secretion pathway protein L
VLRADGGMAIQCPADATLNIREGQITNAAPGEAASALPGTRVELILRPDQFLFRPLELPGRAAEFLEGIVRTQIDRLTPWSGTEAAFGWSKPVAAGPDRIVVTVAATALAPVMSYVRAIAGAGAHSVAVFTSSPDAERGPASIKVWEENLRGTSEIGRIRHALVMILAAAGIAAATAVGASTLLGANLHSRQDEVARQIADIRGASGGARDAASSTAAAAVRAVERRKHDSPSSVIVLDTLSQILPDHTYVTELRIEGNKMRLIGVTRDAPSLIGLIEQSTRFSRATFFAPTTRSPSEAGERFHIEALIQPFGAPRS